MINNKTNNVSAVITLVITVCSKNKFYEVDKQHFKRLSEGVETLTVYHGLLSLLVST